MLWMVLLACDGADDDKTPTETGLDTGDTAIQDWAPCEGPDPLGDAFDPSGPELGARRALAADFTVSTLDGDWTLSENWTGCESYVFLPEYGDLLESDIGDLLDESPDNVHYFFVARAAGSTSAGELAESMATRAAEAMASMDEDLAAHWGSHLHFVDEAFLYTNDVVGDMMGDAYYGAAIDRFQHLREVGMMTSIGSSGQPIEMKNAAYESRYYNFEWTREMQLRADAEAYPTEVVRIYESDAPVGSTTFTADLPADLSSFDTLHIDYTLNCNGSREPGNCPEWDYMYYLNWCEDAEATTCHEMHRMITTYSREGRWVTDLTPLMPMIADGGTQTFQISSSNAYLTTIDLRFSSREVGVAPAEIIDLWEGYISYNSTYNDNFADVEVELGDDVVRAEVVAWITGHGYGVERENCAEFCNHTHHFTVNGGTEHVKDHAVAGEAEGCINQIEVGTVPNQWGTWPYGRGGWCPGLDVPPWRADVTEDVVAGTNTISYTGLFEGDQPYVPESVDGSGFGAGIRINAFLVVYR